MTSPDDTPGEKRLVVHVVDDEQMMRTMIVQVLGNAGFRTADHASGAELLGALHPDESGCIVLDLLMPQKSGLDVLRSLRAERPELPVIMISGSGDISKALDSLRGGAMDFIEKPFRPAQLIQRVEKALALAGRKRRELSRAREIEQRIEGLTPREAELLPLFQQGRSVKEIAFDLGLSSKTVQVHRSNILRVMQAPSVVDLTNLMHELEGIQRGQRINPDHPDAREFGAS